jgi:hypothetical protein
VRRRFLCKYDQFLEAGLALAKHPSACLSDFEEITPERRFPWAKWKIRVRNRSTWVARRCSGISDLATVNMTPPQ